LAAGRAQLVLVRVDLDGATGFGAGAPLPQRAAPAPSGEAGLPRRGDLGLVAGWAAGGAGVLVDLEVVDGEPTRHRAGQRDRLDRLGVAGSTQGRAVCPDP